MASATIAGVLCACSLALANAGIAAHAEMVAGRQYAVGVRPPAGRLAACPGVFVLGARGSGETGFGGFGPSAARMESVARNFLVARHVVLGSAAVSYPADKVTELIPTAREISLFKTDPVKAAKYYWKHNVEAYLASIGDGIAAAVRQAKAEIKACPHVLLILVGYSQGAMVMHQAELRLVADRDTAVLRQIAATILLGDGDRVKNTAAREFGTSADTAEGVRTWLGHNSDQDVPFPATTANICDADDIVCDFGVARVIHWKASVDVHTSYATCDKAGKRCTYSPLLGKAATWAAQLAAGRYASVHWTARGVPVPAGGSSPFLVQVACPSASSCLAAGIYHDSSGNTQGLLDRLSGGTWTASEAPLPANAGANPGVDLFYLACPSALACVAAGDYQDATDQQYLLIETWNGHVWTPAVPLLPADAAARPSPHFNAIACPSAVSCVAVGAYQDSSGSTEGLIETLSGGTWTPATAPLPPDTSGGDSQLEAVACPSVSACVAAGSYQSTGSGGLLEVLSGGTWAPAEAALPPGVTSGFSANLDSVSCLRSLTCVAAGTYGADGGIIEGLIEALNQGTWTPQTAQLPAGAAANPGVALNTVACASSPSCVVVGSYMGSSGTSSGELGLLETLSDGGWAPLQAPLPPGTAADPDASLDSATCESPGSCVVVGSYAGSSTELNLIEILSAGAWTPGKVPLPTGAVAGGEAFWVTCAAAWLCVATATYQAKSGRSEGMILTGPA